MAALAWTISRTVRGRGWVICPRSSTTCGYNRRTFVSRSAVRLVVLRTRWDFRGVAAPGGKVRVLWLINGLGPGGAERLLHAFARVADYDRFAYDVAYLLERKSALVLDLERAG